MTQAQAIFDIADCPVEFRGHLDGLVAGQIRFPRCVACGRHHWYPMKRCPHCYADAFEWTDIEGRVSLHSWTVVRKAFDPRFSDDLPYVVGLAEFAGLPGIRLITNIVECPLDALAVDMPLEPVFAAAYDGRPLVKFKPKKGAAQ
jgi:uncharacterized OB-fold protein